MKRKEKRIVWAILVCIGVFFNMFSGINIVAEEISDASDYSYHILENDMIEITSYQGSETNLNIPSVIDGKTVVKIGEQAFQNSTIESVYVPGTIKEIGTLAFGSCRYLEYVQFNGNAPLINEQAFASVEASVFYPLKNETWVGEMFADYGGTLTWRSKNITMASISELKIRNCEGEVFLSWEADGKVDGFEISYAIVIQAQKVDIPDGEKRTAILQELEQGKTYKVRIRNYINDNSKKIYSLYSEERTIKIPKSHTEISIPGEEATCVKDGKTPGKNCFVCSKILEEQTTIPASHKWEEEYSIDREPSCTQSGEKSIHCENCGEIKEGSQEEIGKSEHKWKEEYSIDREPSCTQNGEKSIHCENCGEIKEGSREEVGKSEHKWKEEYSVDQEPSCTQSGEKSIHCENCGEIKEGSQEEIEKILHKWDVGKVTKSPTATQKGIKVYTCIVCNGTREESILETGVPVKGTMLKVNNNIYKIKKAGKLKGEVIFVKASKNKKSLIIPSTIKTAGITYKVTSIGAGAFKNNKKITKITIGLSVTSIGKEAFKGCNRLSRIIIRSKKLKFVGKNALKNINSSATIKVPRNKLSSYKTLFKNKGQRKKVKIKK